MGSSGEDRGTEGWSTVSIETGKDRARRASWRVHPGDEPALAPLYSGYLSILYSMDIYGSSIVNELVYPEGERSGLLWQIDQVEERIMGTWLVVSLSGTQATTWGWQLACLSLFFRGYSRIPETR